MKNIWLFCFVVLAGMSLSCKEKHEAGPGKDEFKEIFVKSYINRYIEEPNWGAYYSLDDGVPGIGVLAKLNELCVSPEIFGRDTVHFRKLAERNGDVSYDRYVLNGSNLPMACAENYKAIEIVCVDGDWDESHPAGTSLNDLVEMSFTSYADFIRSGYDASLETQMSRRKRMSDLTESDLSMLAPAVAFYFDHCPDKRYEVKITFTTTDGKERLAACKI